MEKGILMDIIVDSGCTSSSTSFKSDFVKWSMYKLKKPIEIEGVRGDIKVEYGGMLQWEFISSRGEVVKMYHKGHYAPALKTTRLMSPQSYFKQKDRKGNFVIQWDKCQIELSSGDVLALSMCPESFLPLIYVFNDTMKAAKLLAYKGSILDPRNLNLTLQKELMKAHNKLGYVSMQWTQ